MKKNLILPRWSQRLKPYLIRRLYESDAQGFQDEALLNEVGWALYSRCKSFVEADEAMDGRARCPVCQTVVEHGRRAMEILCCPACGWECVWKDYYLTIKNQQLNGGPEVVALFKHYLDQFPQAGGYARKMLLIDGLIHGFHHYLRSGRTRRPVGVNLIDGDLGFVIEFLDQLTYGPGSTPGTLDNQEQWRRNIQHKPNPKSDMQGRPSR